MSSWKAWKHRLRHHHPRLLLYNPLPNIWEKLTGQNIENMKPRCTFAEMGKNCPVIAPPTTKQVKK